MTDRPRETTEPHSRLLRCSLCVDESRGYWSHVDAAAPAGSAARAFEDSWFGTKSEAWTAELLSNMALRFAAFPTALRALAAWRDASVDTRTLICHWHLQLTDPLYRAFTGEFLPARFARGRLDLHRATVDDWIAEHGLPRWAIKTRTQFASRLLACARAAGLLQGRRDPLELAVPRVPDDALTYLLYLLRDVDFAGTLVDNPYLASLHLDPATVADRTRALPALTLRRLADVLDLDWRYPDLFTWATARTSQPGARP